MRMVVIARSVAALAVAWTPGSAHAQRYVEEPTDGVALPATPLAGEHDARAVAVNPGGLALIRGRELALALDLEDNATATGAGQGLGAFWATSFGGNRFAGRNIPRFAIGVGLEWLRPPRDRLARDPGEPFRGTLALALPIGRTIGVGAAWRHFITDGALSGVDAFDLGASARFGNYAAFGATVRDLATGAIAGAPVQRRYEAELVLRPFGSDAFDAGFGGRLGEDRRDVDGWVRASARVLRGVYLHAAVESRELTSLAALDAPAERTDRELRATLGLELSFGAVGVTSLVSGTRVGGDSRGLGGTAILRASSAGAPSVFESPAHLERVELAGDISIRELTALVVRLRAIERDPSAIGVVVTFDNASGGWATLEELRDELLRLRKAGKKLFAYMVSGTGRDYYVATAADKIFIDPAGGVRLVGMAGTTMYFRGAFDQFGVLPQFEKIAEYKSAPEQFTESRPTEIAAKMRNELYDSLWDHWVATVAEARKLTRDEVLALVDRGPYSAGDLATDTKLVDAVAGPEAISQLVYKELGRVVPVMGPRPERPERWQRPGVAIIYVDGDITDGKSRSVPLLGRETAGGETVIRSLTAARADPRIGAIILRIDSPGGSALASELISREVFATRGVKPILCSLSNFAASGGYFAAAGCDVIFAEPMTITGSIGIFYGKFEIGGLARKLGITTDTYKRGKRADLESMFRPYTDEERAVLQDKLRYLYGRFIGAVAEGRGIAKDEVDAIGRGHVWSGTQAKPIKLVDRFGGLNDALDEAKRRMGLVASTRVQLVELPNVTPSLLASFAELFDVKADTAGALQLGELPAIRELLHGVPASLLVSPGGAQARLPFEISWE